MYDLVDISLYYYNAEIVKGYWYNLLRRKERLLAGVAQW